MTSDTGHSIGLPCPPHYLLSHQSLHHLQILSTILHLFYTNFTSIFRSIMEKLKNLRPTVEQQ